MYRHKETHTKGRTNLIQWMTSSEESVYARVIPRATQISSDDKLLTTGCAPKINTTHPFYLTKGGKGHTPKQSKSK